MKIYRHKNGNLYTIGQRGCSGTITQHPKSDWWYGFPYKPNRRADVIEIGLDLDLSDFELEFKI